MKNRKESLLKPFIEWIRSEGADLILPERDKQLLVFYLRDEGTAKEIAKDCGISPTRVHQINHRSVRRIIGMIQDLGRSASFVDSMRTKYGKMEELETNTGPYRPIRDIDISVRLYNILRAADVQNLWDLSQLTATDLMKYRGMGTVTLLEARSVLNKFGLQLKDWKEEGDSIFTELISEVSRAESLFPNYNSSHEGYAIIKEELDELWDEVKNNKRVGSVERQKKEAIQVAVTAIRFIKSLNLKENDN